MSTLRIFILSVMALGLWMVSPSSASAMACCASTQAESAKQPCADACGCCCLDGADQFLTTESESCGGCVCAQEAPEPAPLLPAHPPIPVERVQLAAVIPQRAYELQNWQPVTEPAFSYIPGSSGPRLHLVNCVLRN